MGSIPLGTTSGNWKSGGSSVASLSAPVSQGGQLKVFQPTYSNYQPAQGRTYYQTTYNPQNQVGTSSYAAGGGDTGSGGVATGGLTAAQIAAQQQAAQEEAQRVAVRGTIGSLIDQAIGVYDTLYGNVRNAAKEQRGLLDTRYSKETGSLTDQFNAELPKIGQAYAGRGTYDSSYSQDSEAAAGRGFQNQLDVLSTGYEADKAKIGQELMAQEANIGTGKTLLDLTKSKLGEVTDINELRNTQNEIQRKIAELQGQAQSTGSQSGYAAKFSELAPAADRMGTLQSQLTNIIEGAAPIALKRAVAQQIVGSSGLPEEQQAQLSAQINELIG